MTDLWLGGEIGSVVPSSASVIEVEAAGYYDPDVSRCAIQVGSHVSYAESDSWTGQSAIWAHWRPWFENGLGNSVSVFEMFASGTAQVRLLYTEVDFIINIDLQYNSGGTWTTVGSTGFILPYGVLLTLDVNLNIATDTLALYSSGTLIASNTGALDLSGLSNITKFRWYGTNFFPQYISQLMAATTSTIGVEIDTRYPNGAGATASWTGAYVDVDEPVYGDADALSSSAADQVSTFTHTGPSLTGKVIRAVGVAMRGKLGASGPTGLKSVLRISGTDYPHATTKTLAVGYGAHVNLSEVSPATAVAFTVAEVAAMEVGLKSIT